MTSLARQIGALLVFERETGINDIIQTGTMMDAKVTRQLLINILYQTLHFMMAQQSLEEKIMAAGCFLPLTENKFLNKELGTRHRAGLGISEKSDCIALIVSEETEFISLAQNGKSYIEIFLRSHLEPSF